MENSYTCSLLVFHLLKIINAAKQKACRHIAIVGVVAANRRLREKVSLDASKEKFDVVYSIFKTIRR